MNVTLRSTTGKHNYTATDEQGHCVKISGSGSAPSPMQMVLMAGAGCSAIDIEHFLAKMRTAPAGVEVAITGVRREEAPRLFTGIDVHYVIYGDVPEAKAKKAVDLSVDKYCSVLVMLKDGGVKVNATFEVKNEAYIEVEEEPAN